jgi:hypothetical protein
VQTQERGGTASELHSIILKVEPAVTASLSATAQLCGGFTTDPVTMHHLISYSHSPGHRILIKDVNCHLFITMKDSGFLLWKPDPGRNHVKCAAENLEVTFLVFLCMCVCVYSFNISTKHYMLVEFIPSKFMKICKMVFTGIQYIEVICTNSHKTASLETTYI